MEIAMTCLWRAIACTAMLALAPAPSAWAQRNAPPPSAPPAAQAPDDQFGEELTLTPKIIVFMTGNSTWDTALDTLVDAFKSVYAYLDKQGLNRTGPSMTIYTQADDTGFQFRAAVPIAEAPADTPKGDISVGTSPGGRALKFVHRGSYDSMDTTYEAITNYLDEKRLEAQDSFIEEYATDPVTTPEDKFIVTVYVPIK
jgi:effector-binding domain-containing protein